MPECQRIQNCKPIPLSETKLGDQVDNRVDSTRNRPDIVENRLQGIERGQECFGLVSSVLKRVSLRNVGGRGKGNGFECADFTGDVVDSLLEFVESVSARSITLILKGSFRLYQGSDSIGVGSHGSFLTSQEQRLREKVQ